ncbi:hypothetical protein TruAng_012123 [Truncatella angustata]|nr:hypothetical protein TruAng_012123 [Truncatella angustata]
MALEPGQIASIVISIVALVVSATVLISSILQLVHSYLNSTKGYSNVDEQVVPGEEQDVIADDSGRRKANLIPPIPFPRTHKDDRKRTSTTNYGLSRETPGRIQMANLRTEQEDDDENGTYGALMGVVHTVNNKQAS